MKNTKQLIVILLLMLLVVSMFSGCGSISKIRRDQAQECLGENFEIVKEIGKYGDYRVFLVYDTTTKAEYIFTWGAGSTGFCPYYDENGMVAFYEGD